MEIIWFVLDNKRYCFFIKHLKICGKTNVTFIECVPSQRQISKVSDVKDELYVG